MLANIYLHAVLDEWFVHEVTPRLHGAAHLVRYADDFVITFAREDDARRVFEALPKRFERYGLTLHPSKTRLLKFQRPSRKDDDDGSGPGTFDLLGFTHYWGKSQRGNWVVKKRTAKDRLSRTVHRFEEWCRDHRHDPVVEQHAKLSAKLRGHYAYFGVTPNYRALQRLYWMVVKIWLKWLSRRSRAAYATWEWMKGLLKRRPLPKPRVVHQYG